MNLRLAVRRLRQRPAFALTTVLMLAVGIGANATLFSIADAVLLRPLPFAEQDRLIIGGEDVVEPRSEVSHLDYLDWRAATHEIQQLAALESSNSAFRLPTPDPRLIPYRAVSWDFFDVLGVRPVIGRGFEPKDDRKNAAPVIVVSHAFWRDHLGSDPTIAGRPITLEVPGMNGAPGRTTTFTIVGVMPPAFRYPEGAELWTPLVPVLVGREGPGLPDFMDRDVAAQFVLGRLRPGATAMSARRELNGIIAQLAKAHGRMPVPAARVTLLVDEIIGPVRTGLWALVTAAALLLLVACANVAGLMLVHSSTRRREYGIRLSLGASPADLGRLVFWDASILVAVSTLGAMGVSRLALPIARWLLPSIPRLETATTDVRVVAFTLVVGAVAIVACGLVPAMSVSRIGIERTLRRSSATLSSGAFRRRAGRALVIVEVAIAVVGLTAAGLLVRSVFRISGLDVGFTPQALLSIGVDRPNAPEPPEPGSDTFASDVITRLAGLPEVEAAGAISPPGMSSAFGLEGQGAGEAQKNPFVDIQIVTPGYFPVLRTRVAGRDFGDRDLPKTTPVVIVNEALARLAWPGQSAIGRRVRVAFPVRGAGDEWWEVIGVAADVRYPDLAAVRPTAYFSNRQSVFTVWRYFARMRPAPLTLDAMRHTLRAANPGGVIDISPMDEEMARLQRPWRANRVFFGAFAVLTLLLAAIGLYATLAATVAERSREIGVRLAIGATGARIIRDVMSEGLLPVAVGIVVGVGLSVLASQAIHGLLFGVAPADPVALASAPALLILVAVIACVGPAVRASRVDPAIALRES